MKTAVIYARVSTNDQDCQRQIADLQDYAKRAGYKVIEVFQEKASGVKKDRAERAKVLLMARKRQVDVILVTELSRWGRSTQDLLATMEDLTAYNVSLVALNGMQMDLTSATGKLMAAVLSGVAEFERELIQERIRSGVVRAKERGVKFGRQQGQNYKSCKKEKQILEMHKAGASLRDIAAATGLGKSTIGDLLKSKAQ